MDPSELSFSSIASHLSSYSMNTPDESTTKMTLTEIESNAKRADFDPIALDICLNKLCGSQGHAKIIDYKGKYQVNLLFSSEFERNAIITILANQCEKYCALGQFQDWQIGQNNDKYALILSTNQSVALLGLKPNCAEEYWHGQLILEQTKEMLEIQEVNENQITITNGNAISVSTPNSTTNAFSLSNIGSGFLKDIMTYMCPYLSLQSIGRFPQTHKAAFNIFEGKQLWKLFALSNHIQLDLTNDMHPKEQVKNSPMMNIVANLKHHNIFSFLTFVYNSQIDIEERGGICLVPNCNLSILMFNKEPFYHGLVVHKENDRYFLHICPGGDNCQFSEENFDNLMPIAIAKLNELGIVPQYLSKNIGSQPRKTLANFVKWQEKHRNSSI